MNNITKRNKMNNIKKIGLSALAGSLAMVSANAVEYTMSGGLLAVYTTQDMPTTAASSGKGLGVATDLAFAASGELDNGFTVDYAMAIDTNGALSNTSSQMKVGMGSLGSFHINNKFGSKANGIDDISPTAYNETWDGLTASDNPSFFGAATQSGSVDYRIAPQTWEGMTVNLAVTYDPNQSTGPAVKGGIDTTADSGSAIVLQVASDTGIEVGAGYEILGNTAGTITEDGEIVTGYVKYAMGGLTASYQESYANTAHSQTTEGADKASSMMGVAYTMGDLTVSYGMSDLETHAVSDTAALITVELESIQAAYTMGAMTVSVAMSETDNVAGISAAAYSENTLAVSFAF
jgi:outer membrane protein OmpU